MEVIGRYDLVGLKRKKTQAKAACTRTKRELMALMDSDLPWRQIREALQQIDDAQQLAQEIMVKITGKCKSCYDLKNLNKVTGKMEDIEEIATEATERAQKYLDSGRDEASSIATSDSFRRNINNK